MQIKIYFLSIIIATAIVLHIYKKYIGNFKKVLFCFYFENDRIFDSYISFVPIKDYFIFIAKFNNFVLQCV